MSHGSSSEEMATQILQSGRLKGIHEQHRASDTHLAEVPWGSKVRSTGEGNSPLGHKAFGALRRQRMLQVHLRHLSQKQPGQRFNNSSLCLKYVPSWVLWAPVPAGIKATSNLDILPIFKAIPAKTPVAAANNKTGSLAWRKQAPGTAEPSKHRQP